MEIVSGAQGIQVLLSGIFWNFSSPLNIFGWRCVESVGMCNLQIWRAHYMLCFPTLYTELANGKSLC